MRKKKRKVDHAVDGRATVLLGCVIRRQLDYIANQEDVSLSFLMRCGAGILLEHYEKEGKLPPLKDLRKYRRTQGRPRIYTGQGGVQGR